MDVAELTEAFKEHGAGNQAQLMRRVQELMGQGVDVSSLFPSMVSMASTRDITFKKVIYGFLAQYGRTSEELCILSINTLHQDCADLDPIVRSLALRTLCSLGQKSVFRFMLQPLNKGFQDKNAHVRKTSAMACISLFELDPVFVLESEIVDKLYSLLRDRDTQVVVNSILALETILADEGGIVINHTVAGYLISRFKEWTPSQLQVILGVLCRYKPQSDDEIYEIMNNVDDGLQHSSLAVQISTLKLFIWLCQDLNEIHDEVRKTIEETLIKHLESPVPDLVQASLYHLALVFKYSCLLKNENIQYIAPIFCRPNDAITIKIQKVDISSAIASTATPPISTFILDDLCQLAVMKDAHDLQKSSKGKLDRQLLTGYQKVALRSIAAIGYVGSRYRQAQLQLRASKDSQETAEIDSVSILKSCELVEKSCLDRLFALLPIFSGMDDVSGSKQAGQDWRKKTESEGSWFKVPVSELDLEDDQTVLFVSKILTAIEGCWQSRFSSKAYSQEPLGTVFDAHQTKTLGLLLLRHLDQDELDRIAKKKKKPLRLQYDNDLRGLGHESTGSSTSLDSSIMLDSQLLQQQQEELQSGSLSRLARISGIRLLLLEESVQQCLLRKQISSLKDLSPVGEPSVSSDKKLEAAEAALAMRSQYTVLLQQQIQDLAQSIRPARADHLGGRAEHLSLLYLACHLVAFSIEHGEDSALHDLNTASSIYLQRLEILARVVNQLIPEDVDIRMSGLVDSQTKTPSRTVVTGVSRDVADRARLINAMFLNPLVASAGVADQAPDSPLVARQTLEGTSRHRLDSLLFKTEKYLQMVKQKFVAQFGINGVSVANSTLSLSSGSAPEQGATSNLRDAERQDWLFQVGFNTLAITQA
ncbi:AP-4 complex subunit beta-1 [Podila horticola]|nr:AP-4 complex subunit beta-1 [Podila horticola]